MPPKSRLEDRSFWIVASGMAVIVAITLAVIAYTLNRGFDWSDEAFVNAMNSSGRQATGEFWGFQLLLHPVYELLGNSILAFRVLRLLGYIGLSIVIVFVARSALEAIGFRLRWSSWLVVALVAQAGTFAAWSYPPRYLGYNELSSWLTQLGGALLILLLIRGRVHTTPPSRREKWMLWAVWAAVGFVLATLFVAKFTAAVMLGVLALLVALLPASTGRRWTRVGLLTAGAVIAALVMLLVGVPVVAYTQSVIELLVNPEARQATGYTVGRLPRTYMISAATTLAGLVAPIALAAIALVVGFGFPTARADATDSRVLARVQQVALVLTGVLILAVILIPWTSPGDWNALGTSVAFPFFASLVAFAVVYAGPDSSPDAGSRRRTTTITMLIVLFAVIPLVSGMGTGNPIVGQVVFSATLWAIGAGLGLVVVWERSTARSKAVRLIPLLIAGAIVASAGLAVAGEVFLHPYRNAPYLSQKTPVDVADFRGLRLVEADAELVTWLSQTGDALGAAGVPALSTASPGSLFAFNASGWVNPWPGPDRADAIARACGSEPLEDLFVIQSENEEAGVAAFDRVRDGLARCDVDFPGDFDIVAEHPSDNPGQDITIWQLRSG